MSHLVLSGVSKSFGSAPVVDEVSLSIDKGESVVLLGPSGCGKTTCLRMIAGFERPDAGEIWLAERQLAGRRSAVPPERRHMSVVFQSYALWPHMTVAGNVGYGPKTAKAGRAEIRRRVGEALALVQLEGLAERYPHQLSGGQQQRVALARALVNRPALLLLDEPLSNLDTRLREEMRSEIRRIHRSLGVTMVYVTHDQAEALSLADRIVVMRSGRIVQVGTPEEVYRRPRTDFVARALGATNILSATVAETARADRVDLVLPGGTRVQAERPHSGSWTAQSTARVSVRPIDIELSPVQSGPGQGVVVEAIFLGDYMQYSVDVPGTESAIKATGPGRSRLEVGQRVELVVADSAVSALDDRVDPVDMNQARVDPELGPIDRSRAVSPAQPERISHVS